MEEEYPRIEQRLHSREVLLQDAGNTEQNQETEVVTNHFSYLLVAGQDEYGV